ncbi:hypothetical protein ACT8ZV_13460 [Nocardioides sp. MAHUQ-72]|uniref:hypothetical protein n=1 Tax=unclassified Nocardioides TaxID=2615069 RepID=UPI003617DB15
MTIVFEDEEPAAPQRLSVPDQLARLAGRYAADGDLRRAQLASWAGDVHLLEELLWENGLAEADDPVAQLAAVGEAVASALEAVAASALGELTARQVVETAREAMVSTFDESVHEVLMEQFAQLDHLDACDPLEHEPEEGGPAARRLEGRTPEELVAELRAAAFDCLAVAEVMDREGEQDAAYRFVHQADVAAFEAYLVAAAVHAGDHQLATVDLRWDLAGDLDPLAWASRTDDAFATLRRELISLVGSAEMEALWRTIETSGEPS